MNKAVLSTLALSVSMIVLGLYFIYPPLALIFGGLTLAGVSVLFWDVDDG